MKRFFAALLIAGMALSCSGSQIVVALDAIIACVEIAIPVLGPNAQQAIPYLDGALKISTDLIDTGITTAGIAKAIADFNQLIEPVLPPGQAATDVGLVAKAILAFIQAYQGTTVQTSIPQGNALVPPQKTIKLTDKDKAKLPALRARAVRARKALKP
jgi:hypothetical protein